MKINDQGLLRMWGIVLIKICNTGLRSQTGNKVKDNGYWYNSHGCFYAY